MLFLDTFPGAYIVFIWLQAVSNKVCRFKNKKKCEIFAILHFPPFLDPPPPREAVKQLCDS